MFLSTISMNKDEYIAPIATKCCLLLQSINYSVVCVSVCHVLEPRKNGWTDRDATGSRGPKKPYVRPRSRSPLWSGNFLFFFRPIENHYQHCMLQKINNGITAPLLQRAAMMPTGRCVSRYTVSVKNHPAMRPFVKTFWPIALIIITVFISYSRRRMKRDRYCCNGELE